MNVVYSTSDSFLIPTITSINSLTENNPNCSIYILYSELSKINMLYIEKKISNHKSLKFIDCSEYASKYFQKYNLKKVRGNWNTYLRILIPIIFPELDRILYVDSDTLIIKNISKFYNIEFNNNYFAGAQDYVARSKYASIEDEDILEEKYFNCGVFLFNNQLLKRDGISEKTLDFIQHTDRKFRVADQSIINLLYKRKILELDVGFNFYSGLHYQNSKLTKKFFQVDFTERLEKLEDVYIIHFIGHWFERPWFKKHKTIFDKEYRLSRSKTGIEDKLLYAIPFNTHLPYDYCAYLLRKFNLYSLEFVLRYYLMQSLKKLIKIER